MTPVPTFATLRSLHALMGDALDDIHRVFSQSSSPPSSQCSSPMYHTSPEPVSMPPTPIAAATRMIAAAGHIMSIVQKPFLFICGATMGYNLPASMRFLEHLHIIEILREAEDERQRGVHVKEIARIIKERTGGLQPVDFVRLAHHLHLLSTHHILRETAPDTFAITRVVSLLDSGKSVASVFANPEKKYEDTTGIAAFVGMWYGFLSISKRPIQASSDRKGAESVETLPAFNLAFNTPVPFFEWLEDGGLDAAMTGTSGWEAPGAILSGMFPFMLRLCSTIVDVGGGIGSTTMPLARAEDQDMQFRFVVQDRPVVVGLGLAAWHAQCPEMLESRQVMFQDHDFFFPQPALPSLDPNSYPAVYILRVVLHDWPDARARHVLLNLRLASSPETRLVIAEHVLPLACVDEGVHRGADSTLAPAPLLPNFGKVSANPYWMDIMMDITFNGKERTLRELCALALSSGWRIVRETFSKCSYFGRVNSVPCVCHHGDLRFQCS
ncbi:S-adenosyl-L-methionine-dependent methyltransferase [Rhizopogon salebrosus TDB-379]|nr:S-adenosyl-L-methionine-dependent methyltransferase [Rhizopogon salebrosus TDB-379]